MLFTEFRFFLFFIVVWFLYWKISSNTMRKVLLLLGSYLFYGIWDYRFLGLILLATLVDYVVARKIEASGNFRSRRAWLLTSLVSNLGVLFFFKYFNFFTQSLVEFFNLLGMTVNYTTLEIILPVGISFYTFQTLSYTIDVYRGTLKAREELLDFALYVAFFPQLVAGPIVRADFFLPQLETLRKFQTVAVKSLLVLFLNGYIKKVCISDNLAPVVDMVFKTPADFTVSAIFFAVLLYSIQIYCDFSGYSDMAIASAGLLGYKLPVNFNTPYFAVHPTDFWRRWHISLSTWLRDYLYIPLGGGKNGPWMRYRNIMITMLLGGLWHGASWSFLIWGFLHGLALIVHKLLLRVREVMPNWPSMPMFVATLLTYYWVCLAWIFFRAVDVDHALTIAEAFIMLQSHGQKSLDVNAPGLFAAIILAHWLKNRFLGKVSWNLLPDWIFALGLGSVFAIAVAFNSKDYFPFIYFQF